MPYSQKIAVEGRTSWKKSFTLILIMLQGPINICDGVAKSKTVPTYIINLCQINYNRKIQYQCNSNKDIGFYF